MTIDIDTFVDEIEDITNDSANDRTSAATIITYINLAQTDIVIRTRNLGVRPAYTRTLPIQLQAGPTQDITTCKYAGVVISDCIELLQIHRNIGRSWVTGTAYTVGEVVYADPADGIAFSTRYECMTAHTAGTFSTDLTAVYWRTSTDKSGPVVEQIHPANLDAVVANPNYTDGDTDSEIQYWMPDPMNMDKFNVYPPQPRAESTTTALQFVEATYAANPAASSSGGNLTIKDIYKQAIIDYVCYKIYDADDDVLEAGVTHRSQHCYKRYLDNEVFKLR